jgi:hypothetical protein
MGHVPRFVEAKQADRNRQQTVKRKGSPSYLNRFTTVDAHGLVTAKGCGEVSPDLWWLALTSATDVSSLRQPRLQLEDIFTSH